jgi:hypothetical protein
VRRRALLGIVLLCGACARGPLVERAIAARGGRLDALVRQVSAEVREGFPGAWRWRTVFQLPDRYCWSIETTRAPTHYCFDGDVVRAFSGDELVSTDPSPTAPLRSHARFMAVVNLDALRAPGAVVTPLPAAELPPGAVDGVAATLPGDPSRYRLAFDADARLVWAAGPVDLDPFGRGDLQARFSDFRAEHGVVLPHRTEWIFGTETIADERLLAACPDPPGLDAAAFRDPTKLPACPAP